MAMLIQELDKIMEVEPGNEAYLEALRINPSVVKTEADPIQFLRRDDFDVSLAAQRLCRYWNLRKKVFGERFARPLLDLSGNGALTPENVAFVKVGPTVVVDNDDQGRCVMMVDHDRLDMTNLQADQHRLQNAFYLNCMQSQNPKTQTEGFVILRSMLDPFDSKFSAKRFKQTVVNMVDIMPVKLHSFHLCCLPKEKAAKRHFIKTLLPQAVQALGPDLAKKAVINLESTPEKMAEKLQHYGIQKSGIPPKLGGTWSYDDYLSRISSAGTARPPTPPVVVAPVFNSQLNVLALAVESQIQQEAKPAPFAAAAAAVASPIKNLLDNEISLIPNSEKQAYLEAAQQGVFEDPVPFIKICDGDTKKAALRLVAYWKNRKEIFKERAFHPILDLSGNGALTVHEVEALEDGRPCAQLPDTASGSALVYIDHSRQPLSEPIDMDSRLRCVMFLLTRAAANPQVSSVSMLRLVRQADFDRRSLQQLAALAGAMPFEIHNFHFCCLPPKGGSRSNFLDTFVPVYEQLLMVTFGNKAVVHVAEKKTKMLGELLCCGFSKNGLPTTLGGTWSFDNVISWLHQKQPAKAAPDNNDEKPAASSRGCGLKSLADAAHQARIEDRKARKRMMDAIYAKKRRQREKGEQKQLQQQCVELTKSNMNLEQENLRFERMLADAKSKISLVEYGMQIAEKKQSKKRKKKIAPTAAHPAQNPQESAKKLKLDNANLKAGDDAIHSNAEGRAQMPINEVDAPIGPNALNAFHRRQVSMPLDSDKSPATSSTDATTQILELLTKLQKDQQQAQLTKQRDELLMQLLSAKRTQDQQRSDDQESLLQQLAEAMSGRSPQQASTAVSFNEKNSLQQMQLPQQFQGLLSASSQQQQQQQQTASAQPNTVQLQLQLQELFRQHQQQQHQPVLPPPPPPQPVASSIQGLLNQLLVANASQSNGLSGLQGFATTVANPLATPAASFPQANSGQLHAGAQGNNLLQQILGASSTAYASNPASNQLQDFLAKQFRR